MILSFLVILGMERMRQIQASPVDCNLAKSEFGQACITYLGHFVGKGGIVYQAHSGQGTVEAINNFPASTSKSQLMRFLGIVGFY